MEEDYIPFDRYEANVSNYKLATIDYKYDNRFNMNPTDYNVTEEEVEAFCTTAAKYGFASVCINPAYVPLAHKILKNTKTKTCTLSIITIYVKFFKSFDNFFAILPFFRYFFVLL